MSAATGLRECPECGEPAAIVWDRSDPETERSDYIYYHEDAGMADDGREYVDPCYSDTPPGAGWS